MKLLFALYKYFPYGGLQKDMLAIARECEKKGHDVHIFCQSWTGEYPENSLMEVNVIPDRPRWWEGSSNHEKNARFANHLQGVTERIKPDLLIGFNKIPGVDLYYAADTCFKAKLYKERHWALRLLPRYRSFVSAESSLLSRGAKTHILAIAQATVEEYQNYYQTEAERFSLLPPGISKDRVNTNGEKLNALHKELGLSKDKKILLMVGSGFRTKGLDRTIEALAALPDALKPTVHLIVVGDDDEAVYRQQAQQKHIEQQVHFIGGRKDIPKLLKSADMLIHPARRENTGTVLLEAAVACLPVLTVDVCGYSHYINENNLGKVLDGPFEQKKLNSALHEMLTDEKQNTLWQKNGITFSKHADIFSLPARAVQLIEAQAEKKATG